MQIYVTSAYPISDQNFGPTWLSASARVDKAGVHHVVDDPAEADLILFVENHPPSDPYFFRVLFHPLYRRYRSKCFVYHDADYAIPTMPGIYPSIEKRNLDRRRARSFHYLARLCVNDSVRFTPEAAAPQHLFSFVGAAGTNAIRRDVLRLQHPSCLLRDTTGRAAWLMRREQKKSYEDFFAESIRDSKFVLCPRGFGPATYRMFEAMEMGRAPVIISDEWVPFEGPDWSSCSIRVPEDRIADIPQLLAAAEPHWRDMGARARREWERWMSPEVTFHRLVEACLDLQRTRTSSRIAAARAWLQFFEPFHFRNVLRHVRGRYVRRAQRPMATGACDAVRDAGL